MTANSAVRTSRMPSNKTFPFTTSPSPGKSKSEQARAGLHREIASGQEGVRCRARHESGARSHPDGSENAMPAKHRAGAHLDHVRRRQFPVNKESAFIQPVQIPPDKLAAHSPRVPTPKVCPISCNATRPLREPPKVIGPPYPAWAVGTPAL
jgi:hypothetical protein